MQHQHHHFLVCCFFSADPEVLYLHAKACFDCDHKDNLGGFNIQTYLEMLQVQNVVRKRQRTTCYKCMIFQPSMHCLPPAVVILKFSSAFFFVALKYLLREERLVFA